MKVIRFASPVAIVALFMGFASLRVQGQDYQPPDPPFVLPAVHDMPIDRGFLIPGGPVVTSLNDQEPPDPPAAKSDESSADALFRELLAGLPKGVERAKSARLELEYWHNDHFWLMKPPVRKSVKTKDGKDAEVVFLNVPAMGMPGTDFSMAFLLVQKRVVDWTSCWTHNRTANHELQLEDVDGDGFLDVAFRAREGWFGLKDKRQHTRPGDKRKWLYAYAITSRGFQSLFPKVDQDLKVTLTYDTADQPVKLQVEGLPEPLPEQRMVECTLSVTNTSNKDLPIPDKWFTLALEKAGYMMVYGPPDKRPVLKSGDTISQVVRLIVRAKEEEKEVTFRLSFVPRD
jgi:hypothetical protein